MAQRAGDFITRNWQPHVYVPLTPARAIFRASGLARCASEYVLNLEQQRKETSLSMERSDLRGHSALSLRAKYPEANRRALRAGGWP